MKNLLSWLGQQKVNRFLKVGETKMVILVRSDVPMGKGKVASQCAHAAVSLYREASKTANLELETWISTGQPKVVLKVSENSEQTLKELYKKANSSGLNACLIYDAGKTQVGKGTLTALGIGPNNKNDIDQITKDFKLL